MTTRYGYFPASEEHGPAGRPAPPGLAVAAVSGEVGPGQAGPDAEGIFDSQASDVLPRLRRA